MTISTTDTNKVAHLARLKLSEQAVDNYAHQMSNVFALVEKMNALNTDNIEPMAHPLDCEQRLRDDSVTEKNQREQFLKIAPSTEAGIFLVPQVID